MVNFLELSIYNLIISYTELNLWNVFMNEDDNNNGMALVIITINKFLYTTYMQPVFPYTCKVASTKEAETEHIQEN